MKSLTTIDYLSRVKKRKYDLCYHQVACMTGVSVYHALQAPKELLEEWPL